MNVSNLNKQKLIALGLSSVMNTASGRIGYYRHQVIPLGGKFSIDDLIADMTAIDRHWESIDDSEAN